MLRMLLFFGTNIAIMIVLSISIRLLDLGIALEQQSDGLNLNVLLIFSAIFGMSSSLISLVISKWIAKKTMGVKLIEMPTSSQEQWLVSTLENQAREVGIKMPELGIFNSPQPNAFATGMNKNAALVAVSRGLLDHMTEDEIEAVLGHEISHIANDDMVTLTLIQGVVNAFVIFFSRVIGHLIDRLVFKIKWGHGPGYWIGVIFIQMILSIHASIIVMWFSRQREYKADKGGAYLAGRNRMTCALRRLQQISNPQPLPDETSAFGINGGVPIGFKRLFMSHPPLEERIAVLEDM